MKKKVDYGKLPYFEVKVVRVKKGCQHNKAEWVSDRKFWKCSKCGEPVLCPMKYKCNKCGYIFECETATGPVFRQPKAKWINGENLDKIKFPCYCSYIEQDGKKTYGELNKTYNEEKEEVTYLLSDITHQVGYKEDFRHSIRYEDESLERLLKIRKIKIVKGKVILFEETNE